MEYISKSKISEVKRGNKLFSKVPLIAFEEQFNKCRDTKVIKTGSKFDKRRQRHTFVVNKKELEQRVFREYFRLPRR